MRFFRLLPLIIAVMTTVVRAQLPQQVIQANSSSRVFAYTNQDAAFYAGVLNGPNDNGFHGITHEKLKIFEQYWIRLGDDVLDPAKAEVTVTPAGFRRVYPLHNTVEEVFFADSINLLGVIVRSEYRGDVHIYPAFSTWWLDAVHSQHGDIYRMFKEGIQGAVSVTGVAGVWEPLRSRDLETFSNPAPMHLPLYYAGKCTGTFGFSVSFFAAGFPPLNRDVQRLLRLRIDRERRITSLISSTGFSSSDTASTASVNWISASLDALIMQQLGGGIYAGLPWFDDYWGRDTFISFPGALLVTGRFEKAENVLRSFLRYLDRDTGSVTYGRIPNRIQPNEIIYNTVDGTPWMVVMAWEYYRYSGNKDFLREILPDIERTIAGALRYTDQHLLLKHGDAETWMDAVGPGGAWSPRDNRAVDIQALWYAQLRAAAHIAHTVGDNSRSDDWNLYADRVRESVLRYFVDWDGQRIYDHLNDDGTPDLKLRPNMLFPLTIPGADIFAALPDSLIDVALRRLFSEAVYPWGVASLSQTDPDFHPWHDVPRYYPKDAAYHNGTVWTWLTGPAVTALTRRGLTDSAWVLTRSLERLARDAWAVGTIPECTDALPRDGAALPRPSGTFSQAWSNAEYLRNWYQDYLGVTPTWTGDGKPVIRLTPALPEALLRQPGDSVASNVRIGNNQIRVSYYFDGTSRGLALRHLSGADAVRVETGAPEAIVLGPGASTQSAFPQSAVLASAMPDSRPLFALPRGTAGLAMIQPPAWPRIDGSAATRINESAKELCSAFDPENDDLGPNGKQTYPTSPLFKKGIADILWFQVSSDADMLYFTIRLKALTQPGWHPEYGFQLSTLAIAIDQSHEPGRQAQEIGYASGFVLPREKGYDRLIFVGGGLRVTDATGAILCEFIPETVNDAFGSPESATIRFALPRSCIGGGFDHWRYTVVSGLQDDHGGAGIGDFRAVHPYATEWHGGGSAPGVNWYDVLHCPAQ